MVEYSIDAKNFEFEFIFKKGTNWPKLYVNCNHLTKSHSIDEFTNKVNIYIDEEPLNEIVFTYLNKTQKDTSQEFNQCVILQNLWINGIKIELNVIEENLIFYPKYNKEYIYECNSNGVDLPNQIYGTEYNFNGQLFFKCPKPFFKWYHELQLNSLDTANFYIKNSIFGIVDNKNLIKLNKIFENLSR